MRRLVFDRRAALAALLGGAALVAGCAANLPPSPQDLDIFVSGGFTPALEALAPAFEATEGITIRIGKGPSMGTTPNAIPARLERRERADVVILVREALDRLAAEGKVDPATITDLASSRIAMAVKEGAPAPAIATVAQLKSTLLAARSIAYSDSASGVYLSTVLFPRLGIAAEMAGKARMIPATPVGEIVARGEAEIGFQQLSELKAVKGIAIVGPIPEEVQKVTMFSAGIVSYSQQPQAAAQLIAHLASARAAPVIRDTGMAPAGPQTQP